MDKQEALMNLISEGRRHVKPSQTSFNRCVRALIVLEFSEEERLHILQWLDLVNSDTGNPYIKTISWPDFAKKK